MPLSNYLLQTVMATCIFYGWGLGYWNRGGPTDWFALAVGLYLLVQVPLSILWLANFKYGPMEYVWRLLTYGYGSMRSVPAVADNDVNATIEGPEMASDASQSLLPSHMELPPDPEHPPQDAAAEPQRIS